MKTFSIFMTGAVIFLAACSSATRKTPAFDVEKNIGVDSVAERSCPFLTSDEMGNIVLSWVKKINDSMEVMCYAVSKDGGGSFEEPIEVPASKNVHGHGENLPKIIFKPDHEIIAMWGASNPTPTSKYSGLVYYAQSFDEGKTWTDAIALVKDPSAYDQRYYDMALLPNGEAMVIWLDNRGKKTKEGSTLFCATTKGHFGFANERAIGETCCQCCRTDLFVDETGGVHACYRDIINDSIRDMVHCVSTDGGNSFSVPERISADNWVITGCPHTGPTVTNNANGLHFAWYTMGGGQGVFYCNSKDNGRTFSSRDTVSTSASARHPQIVSLGNGNIVIVWDESVRCGEKTNARIGLQMRDVNGKTILSRFMTNRKVISDFPVIKVLHDGSVLVAYRQRKNEKSDVCWKIVKM